MKRLTGALLGLAWLIGQPAVATDIEVLALFGDRAMIRIDGTPHTLRQGESTPEGVRLLAADPAGAKLEVEGRERYIRLGARLRSTAGKQAGSSAPEVTIWRDSHGMFRTVGSINGMPVNFLVDTGASAIALNSAQARRLGVDFRVEGEPARVMTATRPEQAFAVKLDRVKVGGIELRNVDALVFDGPEPSRLLLGMSFLGRLEMNNNGEKLTLRKKY